MADFNSRGNAMDACLAELTNRRDDLSVFLPPDLSFERFYATTHQALRTNPQILDCTPKSIANACIMAAYDGLRIDGREAALVEHQITINRGKSNEAKLKVAQYFPMVFGLIQQVLRAGEVTAIEAGVIHERDDYVVELGLDPIFKHRPCLEGERGIIIASYSVATLKGGAKTIELLDRADLQAMRKAAKTSYVWDNWPGEMAKKSAVRRHRKRLPMGDRDVVIHDGEETLLVDGFDHEQAPAAPARPTRQSIANNRGAGSGVPLDMDDGVTIDAEDRQAEKVHNDLPQKDKAEELLKQSSDESGKTDTSDNSGNTNFPVGDDEWAAWAKDTAKKLRSCDDAEAVQKIMTAERARLEKAPKDERTLINATSTEVLTTLAIGGEDA